MERLTEERRSQILVLRTQLKEAMIREDEKEICEAVGRFRMALGDHAGFPEVEPRFAQPKEDKHAPNYDEIVSFWKKRIEASREIFEHLPEFSRGILPGAKKPTVTLRNPAWISMSLLKVSQFQL